MVTDVAVGERERTGGKLPKRKDTVVFYKEPSIVST